jgi:hypothetical protein
MQQNQSEVDINVLVSLYHQKLSQLSNQIILLEAKLQTLTNDFSKEKKSFYKKILICKKNMSL